MQGKNRLTLYIFLIIIVTALFLRVINSYTKNGKVTINNKTFKVELLKEGWELQKGLSGREKLSKNKGILFIFPKADKHSFWMKEMKFSIDILWIDNDKIIDIKEKLAIPITHNLKRYTPSSTAKYVLEINSGLSEKYGFKVGDKVKLDI
tara:strand:+ start:63 stop:512 length:450 start_codon:yes stop_codon:yes gene_type:complete